MSARRAHNHGQIVAFLDKHYPNSAPGSPDPDQAYDDNKKTSRVILKAGAWKRADSDLGARDERGNLVDLEIACSYRLLSRLFEEVPARLDEKEARKKRYRRGDAYRLATRHVMMNVNTAGGYEELLWIEDLGRSDPAAKAVARMCRGVIRGVLDELDGLGYWLGWGTDAADLERQAAVKDRKTKGPNADEGAIALYYDLMARSHPEVNVCEYLTAQHFGLSMRTVRRAVKAALEAEEEKAS